MEETLLPEKDKWALGALKDLLLRERGWDLEAYKERCLLRRILLRARSRGCEGLGDYYRVLTHDPAEVERLFHHLTIHVTQFFRNPTAFRFLRSRILPGLVASLAGGGKDHTLRCWSAGCSTGEEAFSLAMLLKDVERELGQSLRFHIFATDVDAASLEKAHRGVYPKEALRNLSPEETAAWFTPVEGGGFRVREELRKMVVFRQGDLLADAPTRSQHLVLCRNLLIYFSREEQEKVLERLADVLLPGGYLLLGKAETLVGRNRNYFLTVSPTERIYQKRDLPLEGGERPWGHL